ESHRWSGLEPAVSERDERPVGGAPPLGADLNHLAEARVDGLDVPHGEQPREEVPDLFQRASLVLGGLEEEARPEAARAERPIGLDWHEEHPAELRPLR